MRATVRLTTVILAALAVVLFMTSAGVMAQPPRMAKLQEAVGKAFSDLGVQKGSDRLCVLTNAPYVNVGTDPGLTFLDMVQGITGCSMISTILLSYQVRRRLGAPHQSVSTRFSPSPYIGAGRRAKAVLGNPGSHRATCFATQETLLVMKQLLPMRGLIIQSRPRTLGNLGARTNHVTSSSLKALRLRNDFMNSVRDEHSQETEALFRQEPQCLGPCIRTCLTGVMPLTRAVFLHAFVWRGRLQQYGRPMYRDDHDVGALR